MNLHVQIDIGTERRWCQFFISKPYVLKPCSEKRGHMKKKYFDHPQNVENPIPRRMYLELGSQDINIHVQIDIGTERMWCLFLISKPYVLKPCSKKRGHMKKKFFDHPQNVENPIPRRMYLDLGSQDINKHVQIDIGTERRWCLFFISKPYVLKPCSKKRGHMEINSLITLRMQTILSRVACTLIQGVRI